LKQEGVHCFTPLLTIFHQAFIMERMWWNQKTVCKFVCCILTTLTHMWTAVIGTVVLSIHYEVKKKQHLVIRQHPFHCDLISATKPFVRFLWNSVPEFTEVVEEAWVLWKSARWQSYFSCGYKWISTCMFLILWQILVKFSTNYHMILWSAWKLVHLKAVL
jgi:hypothetical protein